MMQNNEKIIVHVDSDLKELIPEFIQRRHNDIKTIFEALNQGDYETIRILGHSMKGAGGGYGFDVISDIGLSLEQAAKRKDQEEIQKQAGELSIYLEHVEIIYD